MGEINNKSSAEYLDRFLSQISESTTNPSAKRWINEVLRTSVRDMLDEEKASIFDEIFIENTFENDYKSMVATYYLYLKEEWKDAMHAIEEKGCLDDQGALINFSQALDAGKIYRMEKEKESFELLQKERYELNNHKRLEVESRLEEDWNPEFSVGYDELFKVRKIGKEFSEKLSIQKCLNEYRITLNYIEESGVTIHPDVLWQGTMKECIGFANLVSKHLSEEREFYNRIKNLDQHRVKAGQNYGLDGEVWFQLSCEGAILMAEISLEKDGVVTNIGRSGVEISPIQARFILAQPTVSGGSDLKPQFTGKRIAVEVYDLLEKFSGLPRVPHGKNGVNGVLTNQSLRFWEKRAVDRKVVGMDCKGTEVRKRVIEEKLKLSFLEREYRNEYCFGINLDALSLCRSINQHLGWPIYAQVKQLGDAEFLSNCEKIWCKTPDGYFFDVMGEHTKDEITSELGESSLREVSKEELAYIYRPCDYDEIVSDALYLMEKHEIAPDQYILEDTTTLKF